jgi:hypothetical protein
VRNTKWLRNGKLPRVIILSAFYNISQRNFGILLILWCSFKAVMKFLSRSKFCSLGNRSIHSSQGDARGRKENFRVLQPLRRFLDIYVAGWTEGSSQWPWLIPYWWYLSTSYPRHPPYMTKWSGVTGVAPWTQRAWGYLGLYELVPVNSSTHLFLWLLMRS